MGNEQYICDIKEDEPVGIYLLLIPKTELCKLYSIECMYFILSTYIPYFSTSSAGIDEAYMYSYLHTGWKPFITGKMI